MAVTVDHTFTCAIADNAAHAAQGRILPSHWNASHTVANAVDKTGDTMTGQMTVAQGTITTSQPFTWTQTWDAGAVTFTGLKLNVTNTASGASSLLVDLQVGGVSKFYVTPGGTVYAAFRFEAQDIFLGGYCVLTGAGVSSRRLFLGGFSNKADAFTGGAGVVFTNAAGSSIYALFEGLSSGLVELNNGTTGTYADLNLRVVKTSPLTVATLPTGAAGMRSFVTDANATTFASVVAGGGANGVPVYHDGTNWRIG